VGHDHKYPLNRVPVCFNISDFLHHCLAFLW
jgi:hypothetical protein